MGLVSSEHEIKKHNWQKSINTHTVSIINIIKLIPNMLKIKKYHVYKRTEKVYNNPHPGSGVV